MTTSVSREAAGGAPFPPTSLSLGTRLMGMVRRPGATFQAITARPVWAGVLTATTMATALAGALLTATGVGRVALVDQWERTAYAFGHELNPAEYARLQELGGYGPGYAAATAIAGGPLLALGVAVVAHLAFRRGAGVLTSMTQAFAVAAHAGVILALRQLVAAPAAYVRETTANGLALGVWLPVADPASALGRFLGVLDVFVLWWVVVLAIGLGVLYRRRAGAVAVGLLAAYAGFAGLLTLAMNAASGPP